MKREWLSQQVPLQSPACYTYTDEKGTSASTTSALRVLLDGSGFSGLYAYPEKWEANYRSELS